LGQRKVTICLPHAQIALAASDGQWSATISTVLWCLWGVLIPAHAQDVNGWSTFCTAAQPDILSSNSGCLLGFFYWVGTSVTWCWEHQIGSPEAWLGHASHQLDPDQCQFVARSEVSTCPSQGDASRSPALRDYESSHRIIE